MKRPRAQSRPSSIADLGWLAKACGRQSVTSSPRWRTVGIDRGGPTAEYLDRPPRHFNAAAQWTGCGPPTDQGDAEIGIYFFDDALECH